LNSVASALEDLLPSFAGPGALLGDVRFGDGNAGFSYIFDATFAARRSLYFLRLTPPGVRRAGIADVFRQRTALRALDATAVPHARVLADGEHPVLGDYLVTSVVPGRNRGVPGSLAGLGRDVLDRMAEKAMAALAEIHGVAPSEDLAYLGPLENPEDQVTRWDRFFEKGEYAAELARDFEEARARLLDGAPTAARRSLCHGDYQFGNLMFTDDGELTAVIDWELCGVAPSLSDLGWMMAFHDKRAWGTLARESSGYFDAGQLCGLYERAGGDCAGVTWFQALAHYKYAVIASLNLSLHRRGKRFDPEWEIRGPGAITNMSHAVRLLRVL
jgi:aminoglycoside phosphotransferase (APT) family kinase protein